MFTRSFFLFALFIALSALCFVGCGSKPKKTYQVAMDPLWYPLDFMRKENNVAGFSSELLNNIAEEESISISCVNTNWDTLFQGLNSKNYQAILSSLQPYNFNLKQYDFSDLYLPTGPVLILPFSSSYQSLKEMKNREIGAITGTSSVLILEAYPKITIRTYDNASSLINDLLLNRIDGALLPILIAESFTRGSFLHQIKIASDPLNKEGLRLITLPGKEPDLLDNFNKGLKEMQKNGKYDQLLARWQLIQTSSK